MAAGDPGSGDNAVANPQSRHFGTGVDHATDELVAQDNAGAAQDRPVIPFRGIGPADRGAENLEHDLGGGRR